MLSALANASPPVAKPSSEVTISTGLLRSDSALPGKFHTAGVVDDFGAKSWACIQREAPFPGSQVQHQGHNRKRFAVFPQGLGNAASKVDR